MVISLRETINNLATHKAPLLALLQLLLFLLLFHDVPTMLRASQVNVHGVLVDDDAPYAREGGVEELLLAVEGALLVVVGEWARVG